MFCIILHGECDEMMLRVDRLARRGWLGNITSLAPWRIIMPDSVAIHQTQSVCTRDKLGVWMVGRKECIGFVDKPVLQTMNDEVPCFRRNENDSID